MFTQQSTKTPDVFVEDTVQEAAWNADAKEPASRPQQKAIFQRIREHDWVVALLYAACDIVYWIVLYAVVSYVRRGAFYGSAFEFVLVDVIALTVLLQALFIVGSYNRNTETRSLTYTAEHVLAVAAAAAISALIIYSAAAYEEAMKPSRGVLLISFVLFLPISLAYRRLLRANLAARRAPVGA